MEQIRKYFHELQAYGLRFVNDHVRKKVNKSMDAVVRKITTYITRNNHLKNTIIIESHNDFDCNGGAFYDYLIQNNINDTYKIVWLVKHRTAIKLPNNVEKYDIWKFSIKKNYYISTASIFLSDDIVTDRVRNDQISVYCTHGGCTFKNVRGMIVVPESVNYVLSSSKAYDPYMCDNYSILYPNKKMLHLGFPSNDVFFNLNKNEFKKIDDSSYYKYFLWMPTFRKGGGLGRNDSDIELSLGVPIFENIDQLQLLNHVLEKYNSILVIKIHPMQDPQTIKGLRNLSNIFVLDGDNVKKLDIDNYRLMASSDAFISDYSSASYSYLMLNRPIGFVLADMEHYRVGFTVDNIYDYMPGEWIYTYDDFVQFIQKVANGCDKYREKRTELLNWMYEYKDGDSCKRLAQFLNLM